MNYIGIPGARFQSLMIQTPFQVSGARTNCPIVAFVQLLLGTTMLVGAGATPKKQLLALFGSRLWSYFGITPPSRVSNKKTS